jgi:N-hydroxyarylamine O-acetyltransferase
MHDDQASNYLRRIKLQFPTAIDADSFAQLHLNHVLQIPFENLDIQHKKPFDLHIESIYKKIVDDHRGGFCYELNLLFNELLTSLGYQSRVIEARIFN